MEIIMQGILQAIQLLIHGDYEVLTVTMLTLKVSGAATGISVILGVPIGLWLALKDFRYKQLVSSIVNFGMGMPPVVVGLIVSILFWRYGPMGQLGIMYTPVAMIIAQTMIATPIIAGLSMAAILSLNEKLRWQLVSMGATSRQANWLLIREARFGLMAAVIAGFGRVISEVGASMMVGGNIKDQTRVLTTATVMEVGKGNYDVALSISFILLSASFGIVALFTYLQHGGKGK